MMKIQTAKPNPYGKDKSKNEPKREQLIAEWVTIENTSKVRIELSRLKLAHTEYDKNDDPKPKPKIYWNGTAGDFLNPGQKLRIHAGHERDCSLLQQVDIDGTDLHAYTEEGEFVLNNEPGDVIYIYLDGNEVDRASYTTPTEGAVLIREGAKLVEVAAPLASAKPWGGVHTVGNSNQKSA